MLQQKFRIKIARATQGHAETLRKAGYNVTVGEEHVTVYGRDETPYGYGGMRGYITVHHKEHLEELIDELKAQKGLWTYRTRFLYEGREYIGICAHILLEKLIPGSGAYLAIPDK